MTHFEDGNLREVMTLPKITHTTEKSYASEYLTQTRLVSDKRFQNNKDIYNAKKDESKKVYEQSKQCGTADEKITKANFQKKKIGNNKDVSNAKNGESKKVYEQSKQCGTADVKMTNAKFQKETIGNNEDVSNATCTPRGIICINVHHC